MGQAPRLPDRNSSESRHTDGLPAPWYSPPLRKFGRCRLANKAAPAWIQLPEARQKL